MVISIFIISSIPRYLEALNSILLAVIKGFQDFLFAFQKAMIPFLQRPPVQGSFLKYRKCQPIVFWEDGECVWSYLAGFSSMT